MLDAPIVLAAPSPTARLIYDSLIALGIGTAGSWLDCAARLDLAAADAERVGQVGRARGLRDRADDCQSRARRLVVLEVQS